jgi:hypothetical protein
MVFSVGGLKYDLGLDLSRFINLSPNETRANMIQLKDKLKECWQNPDDMPRKVIIFYHYPVLFNSIDSKIPAKKNYKQTDQLMRNYIEFDLMKFIVLFHVCFVPYLRESMWAIHRQYLQNMRNC